MNELAIVFSIFGPIVYIVGAIMAFCSVTSSWTNPWPGDKAFALAVFWPVCLVLFLGKDLVTGVIKLAKEFVS